MTEQALRKMIAAGESTRQEFKSWVKCKDYRQRKELAVKSAVALANTKGGVLLFGVEDDGTITGCPKSDPQALMEAIYDMTRPSLFTEIEPVETSDGVVLLVSVEKSNSRVATTSGIINGLEIKQSPTTRQTMCTPLPITRIFRQRSWRAHPKATLTCWKCTA